MAQSLNTSNVITPTPLPPLPDNDTLSQAQWVTLLALVDTFIPSIVGQDHTDPEKLHIASEDYSRVAESIVSDLPEGCSKDDVGRYLEEKGSDVPAFRDHFRRIINIYIPAEARRGLSLALAALK